MTAHVTAEALAEVRGQAIHKEITAALETPERKFTPSPVLKALHDKAKRLERNLNASNLFNPRLAMRRDRAAREAAQRWVAEVEEFERANPDTAAETPEATS